MHFSLSFSHSFSSLIPCFSRARKKWQSKLKVVLRFLPTSSDSKRNFLKRLCKQQDELFPLFLFPGIRECVVAGDKRESSVGLYNAAQQQVTSILFLLNCRVPSEKRNDGVSCDTRGKTRLKTSNNLTAYLNGKWCVSERMMMYYGFFAGEKDK